MRILHVVPTYAPGFRYGGPVASVRGLAEAQARRGDLVTVATTDCDDGVRLVAPASEELGGVWVRRFAVRGPLRLRRSPDLGRWLARAAGEFDVVHAHGVFVWTTTAALGAARRAGTPAVLAPRGMLMAPVLRERGRLKKRVWLAAMERRNFDGVDALHLTARAELDALPLSIAPRALRFVVPNGVTPEPWDGSFDGVPSPLRAACERGSYALFLGRINWKKGLDLLADALAATPTDVSLVVAGPDDGYGRQLAARIAERDVASRCHVVGAVSGRTKAALLEHARALVLPSRWENFGNVALEAMAAGVPALVTTDAGVSEVVQELGGGRAVEATAEAFSRALTDLVRDTRTPLERTALAARTRSAYGWDSIAAAMARAYAAIGVAGAGRAA